MTVLDALSAGDSSIRLRAALAAGTDPDVDLIEPLVVRCGVEPDFFVRDMLTWALNRYPSALTTPLLLEELDSARPQARSQALHTLSKIGYGGTWPFISWSLLRDADDEVARSAWRAAVILAPVEEHTRLSSNLASQLGRGNREVHRSLSRALVALGDAIEPALDAALTDDDPAVRTHACATRMLLVDPDGGFDGMLDEARKVC